jgi:DNA-binding GntR family transcriptional regulator
MQEVDCISPGEQIEIVAIAWYRVTCSATWVCAYARMPEPGETEHLGLPAGTPVVEIARLAYDVADRIIEVNEMTADATAYIFRYDFSPD